MRDIEFRAFTSDGMVTPYMWISKDNLPCYKLGSSPKAPLMQYAGLKDSKGVKIFEGDVVYLVGYGDYICEFPFIDLFESYMGSGIGEIKGNIYEHPHLLESNQ